FNRYLSLILRRIGLWWWNFARGETALPESYPDDDKHDNSAEATTAELFGSVAGDQGSEEVVHDTALWPVCLKLYACSSFKRISSPSSPLTVRLFSTRAPSRSGIVERTIVPENGKDSGWKK